MNSTPTLVNFTVANAATGLVKRTGSVFSHDLDTQAQPGEVVVEGFYSHTDFYYDGTGMAAFPPQPGEFYTWDAQAKAWSADLAQARATTWERLKTARDAAEYGGFVWDSSTFDSDEVSQSRIQGAALAATLASLNGQPFSTDWTLADNTVRTLDGPSMIQAGMALMAHITAQHEKGRLLRQQVEDPTATYSQIVSVAW